MILYIGYEHHDDLHSVAADTYESQTPHGKSPALRFSMKFDQSGMHLVVRRGRSKIRWMCTK